MICYFLFTWTDEDNTLEVEDKSTRRIRANVILATNYFLVYQKQQNKSTIGLISNEVRGEEPEPEPKAHSCDSSLNSLK